jgi:hypothetical protein
LAAAEAAAEHHVAMVIEATESAPTVVNAAVNTDGVELHVTTAEVAAVVEDPLEVVPHY